MVAILLLRTSALGPGEERVVEAMFRGHLMLAGAPPFAPPHAVADAGRGIDDEDAAVAVACLRLACDAAFLAHAYRDGAGVHVDVEPIAADGRRGLRVAATVSDLDALHPALARMAAVAVGEPLAP